MLSILIFLALAVAIIAGVAYFIFQYGDYIINSYNAVFHLFSGFITYLPDWLLPSAAVVLLALVLAFFLKIL